jgi:Ca2+-binding EF-hand superfamily protein
MDRDNSGKISVENIKDLMCGVGEEITEADLTEMFQHADVTGDGMVSYGEFERVIHLHEAEQQTMRELFDALDVSGTGVLTADDLTTFLEMNGTSTCLAACLPACLPVFMSTCLAVFELHNDCAKHAHARQENLPKWSLL